jgi:NAD-dependent dihydropyrimidine dehydrogenase PreA subunit
VGSHGRATTVTGLAYISGVATIELDRSKCNSCRVCLQVCPHAVFGASNGVIEIIDQDRCMECGACVLNCAEGALIVHPGTGCALAILKGWITRSEASCC